MRETLRGSLGSTAVIGIDIGENRFHAVGRDERGAISCGVRSGRVARLKQLADIPPCLIWRAFGVV